MRIITFTDGRYSKFAEALLTSLSLAPEHHCDSPAICYTVDKPLPWRGPECEVIPICVPDHAPRINYFKPRILLDALDRFPNEFDFCYLDADMIVGRRFDVLRLLDTKSNAYPLAPSHIYEVPICDINGIRQSPAALCEYFNVPVSIDSELGTISGHSCPYTQNCLILFNRTHREFLLEWKLWCENSSLWRNPEKYFQYQDETAFNVLLWKYGAVETLGYIHTTLTQFSAFRRGEESDCIVNEELQPGLPWSWCHDSRNLMIYHGTKDSLEAARMIRWLETSM